MIYYVAVVKMREDNAYSLYFPDIEGLTVVSNNILTLLKNATDALVAHFENNEAPAPCSLSKISSVTEVKEQIKNGATLHLVPHRENRE